jgi:hypothetical protein
MRIYKNTLLSIFKGLLFTFLLVAATHAQEKFSSRVLLIPLDDRPPCLQKPVELGAIADAEIVTPPRELLGKFTRFGESDKIIEWLKKQDLRKFDAAIVSLDMLAYGGLVAMREYETTRIVAQKRIDFVREMKRKNPKLPIYGSSVIMRLAPTGNVTNEAYRVKLSRWAEISSETSNAKLQEEARKLEKEIPAEALANYKKARERDLAGNFQAIELAKQGVFDYLIVSQDDAHPTGVHIAERESLVKRVNELNLTEKVPVQPGADEVSMLLMARFFGVNRKYSPRIFPIYSSEESRTKVMPFEDRKLHETISFHIKSVGGQEVSREKDADILFYAFGSRFETGRAKTFLDEIEASVKAGKNVMLIDVDPSAKTEGGDIDFSEDLKNRGIFRQLQAYAAWNTAGNMIGTALPQALIFNSSKSKFPLIGEPTNYERDRARQRNNIAAFSRVAEAQDWFLFHRWLDDYVYNTLIRAEVRKYAREKNWNQLRFDEKQSKEVEAAVYPKLQKRYEQDKKILFSGKNMVNADCNFSDKVKFYLPWNRAFEAEIDFDLKCK